MADASMVANERLREWIAQIETVRAAARELAGDLTREQLNWRPDATRWSVGQCLQHLTLTARLYPEAVERMLVEARARHAAGGRAFGEGWLSRKVVEGMEPPPKMRVRTSRKATPPQDLDPERVLSEFEDIHERIQTLMVAADGVPLQHARMRSPFLPLLQFTLSQVFAIIVSHARRHLWQARQVREHPGFPRAATSAVSGEQRAG